jgi:hypothetical protein
VGLCRFPQKGKVWHKLTSEFQFSNQGPGPISRLTCLYPYCPSRFPSSEKTTSCLL